MVHSVCRLSATSPALPSWADSAMVKQPACAAASKLFGIRPLAVFKAAVERIRRVVQSVGGGRERAFARLQIALPLGLCGTFHSFALPLRVRWPGVRNGCAVPAFVLR